MNCLGTIILIKLHWVIRQNCKWCFNGDIIIKGSGDPTLGSWRYTETKKENIISEFEKAISQEGINEIKRACICR